MIVSVGRVGIWGCERVKRDRGSWKISLLMTRREVTGREMRERELREVCWWEEAREARPWDVMPGK